MSEFYVETPVLRAAGKDLRDMADTVGQAQTFADTWMRADDNMGGGIFLANAGDEINSLNSKLWVEYSPAQTEGTFRDASRNLYVMAMSYDSVDADQHLSYDNLLKDVDVEDRPPKSGQDAGVEQDEIAKHFEPPENAFEAWDEWRDINDKAGSIVGFDWLTAPLDKFGIGNPVSDFKKEFEGSFEGLGKAISAIGDLRDYWYRISDEVLETAGRFPGRWQGNAADAATQWMSELSTACFDHAGALSSTGLRIKAEALYMKSSFDLLVSLLEDIADCIPDIDSMADVIVGLFTSAAKILGKIIGFIERFMQLLDLAIVAANAIISVFAQLSRGDVDMDVPDLGYIEVTG